MACPAPLSQACADASAARTGPALAFVIQFSRNGRSRRFALRCFFALLACPVTHQQVPSLDLNGLADELLPVGDQPTDGRGRPPGPFTLARWHFYVRAVTGCCFARLARPIHRLPMRDRRARAALLFEPTPPLGILVGRNPRCPRSVADAEASAVKSPKSARRCTSARPRDRGLRAGRTNPRTPRRV